MINDKELVEDVIEAAIPAEKRKVFRYFDGEKEVWGDPLFIQRRLEYALHGRAMQIIKDALASEPQPAAACPPGMDPTEFSQVRLQKAAEYALKVFQAKEALMPAVRTAFNMKAFDRNAEDESKCGATELDCRNAIEAWLRFYVSKKKPVGDLPS